MLGWVIVIKIRRVLDHQILDGYLKLTLILNGYLKLTRKRFTLTRKTQDQNTMFRRTVARAFSLGFRSCSYVGRPLRHSVAPRPLTMRSPFQQRSFLTTTTSFNAREWNEPSIGVPMFDFDSAPRRTDSTKLLTAVSEVERLGGEVPKLPKIVVIGGQSSGKTSLLEALMGVDILHTDIELGTKKKTTIVLIRSDTDYRQFKIGEMETSDPEVAKREILKQNNSSVYKEVAIEIHSPDVHNLVCEDVPGLVTFDDNNPDRPGEFTEITRKVLQDKDNIILVVLNATQDPQTSMALKMVHEAGRANDCVIVLTKCDLTVNQSKHVVKKMLSGTAFNWGLGCYGVVLRNSDAKNNGTTPAEQEAVEADFFSDTWDLSVEGHTGLPVLKKFLADIQARRIEQSLPAIVTSIDKMIAESDRSRTFIQKVADDPALADKLTEIAERLVGSSIDSALLQERIRERISTLVSESVQNVNDLDSIDIKHSTEYLDADIRRYMETHNMSAEMCETNRFKTLFSAGQASPVVISNRAVREAYAAEHALGCFMSMFKITVDEENGIARALWEKRMKKFFHSIKVNGNMADDIYTMLEKETLDYIEEDADEVSLELANYVVEAIGKKSFAGTIKDAVNIAITLQEKTSSDAFELTRPLVNLFSEELKFTSPGIFGSIIAKKKPLIEVETFGPLWTAAHLDSVREALSDDFYRLVVVAHFNTFVNELFKMTIHLFKDENATAETEKLRQIIASLKELRTTITKR